MRNREETGARSFRLGEIPTSTIVFASVTAFLGWAFSAFNFALFGFLLPVLMPTLGWSYTDLGMVLTAISIGTFLTSLTVGPLTDYLGRRVALAMCVIGAALSSGLMFFSTLFSGVLVKIFVIIVRSLSGYGISVQAVNATYLNEIYSAKKRGLLLSFVQGGFVVGALLAAIFALFLLPIFDWPKLFLIASTPIIAILLAIARLPESPRFIHLKEIRRAKKEGDRKRIMELLRLYDVNIDLAEVFTIKQLFAPDLRRHTTSLMTAFCLQWFVTAIFYVLGTTVLTVGKGISFASSLQWLAVTNGIAYFSNILFGYVGDRVPRRNLVILCWVVSGSGFVSTLFLNGFLPVIATYVLGYIFQNGAFTPFFSYIAESFPTRARGTGASMINSVGQIGNVIAFVLFSALATLHFDIIAEALYIGGIPALLSPLFMLGARNIQPRKELELVSI